MKKPRKDLPTELLSENVYRLNEFDGTNCYLVVGNDKALLIDCGTGFCDIRGAVEKITDKPVILAATHAHGDHIGGCGQFEKLYVHKDDVTFVNFVQKTYLSRFLFTLFNKPVRDNGISPFDVMKNKFKTEIVTFDDGFVFDLGGKIVRVHHTPGHSKGSVAFVDETDKIVFSGDNVCDALWMQLPGATSLEEWLPGAKWLYETSNDYAIYWGHRVARLTKDYIGTVIGRGEEIIKNQTKNALFSRTKQYPNQPDGIIYRTGNVHKKHK